LLSVFSIVAVSAAVPGFASADDLTPPDPPERLFVLQGSNWRAESDFNVWWNTPPGQETPIAAVHYQLCPAIPLGPCTNHQVDGPGISELELTLPYAGWFWLRAWLEDEQGNVDPSDKSDQVMLRFDDGVPPEAQVRGNDGWLGADALNSPEYVVEIPAGKDWPVSGIAGYSITLDLSLPDSDMDIYAAQDNGLFRATYTAHNLAEGITTLRLRSVSNSGIPSDEVGIALLRLDRTPPSVAVGASLQGGGWSREALVIELNAHDQAALSGMDAAGAGQQVEDGGHVAYEVNTAPTQKIPGDRAELVVSADGEHKVTYRAFDVAGNGSAEKEAVFRIDRTAPAGSFRVLDPRDPRALKVDVADATSGVADGWIEYRRAGDRGFSRLATTHQGGVLSSRLDDAALPAGRYVIRAVVHDVAGNEAIVDSWSDGLPAALGMPVRLGARLEVAGEIKAQRCSRAKRSKRAANGKRKRSRNRTCRVATKPIQSLALVHGKRAKSTGTLKTAQGVPIAHAPVIVEGQPRSGGAYARLGSATTDAQGRFHFTIPPGSSRTVRYRYDGTDTVRPTTGDIATKVKAAARLKVDRRRLRNGQTVRFSGRLLGRPIPPAGKLVALQAKIGRGWRTFATPRANAKGRFSHRYRFTATTGTRRYAFRVVVAREDAYPYERGVSRIVKVTVRGR
jgi:hypothetical protein